MTRSSADSGSMGFRHYIYKLGSGRFNLCIFYMVCQQLGPEANYTLLWASISWAFSRYVVMMLSFRLLERATSSFL